MEVCFGATALNRNRRDIHTTPAYSSLRQLTPTTIRTPSYLLPPLQPYSYHYNYNCHFYSFHYNYPYSSTPSTATYSFISITTYSYHYNLLLQLPLQLSLLPYSFHYNLPPTYSFACRSEFIFRERLGLSAADHRLLNEPAHHHVAPHVHGSPFAVAWRNYLKSVFKRGFWYKLSSWPSVFFYVSENKTLAGKEDKNNEGEAYGRKMALAFFEAAGGDIVQRVDKSYEGLKVELLSVAELLQTCGQVLPVDPARSAAESELLLEQQYETLEILRFTGTSETAGDDVHTYCLSEAQNAEEALSVETAPQHRTKMMLARCLERNEALDDQETIQVAWALSVATLQARTEPYLPAPQAPQAPPAQPAAGGRGRGRGRGRGKGRARGQ